MTKKSKKVSKKVGKKVAKQETQEQRAEVRSALARVSTLRPGLLVSLKSSVTGNVSYIRRDLEHENEKGKTYDKWETERTISDKKEWEAASQTRTAARIAITKVCARSAFGLLCPEERADEYEAAVVEARNIVEAFNEKAKLTRVQIFAIAGRIAPDDVEAVRAINSEVRDLMESMQEGLKNLDAKVVRDAAMKAKQIGSMLNPDAQARIQIAIDAARASAREIVRAGETGAKAIDKATIRKITEQRTAFLDLDGATEIAKPVGKSRAVDFTPEDDAAETRAAKPTTKQVELEL
jgi:uncharacterized protein with ACT and thioredoxin-like domain